MDESIEAIIGLKPSDTALYERALTHGSAGAEHYQRLEFLGDRVLGLVVAEMLYQRDAEEAEGNMAHRLNALVSGATCAEVARKLGLPPLVRLGKQARDDGARESDNVLGDVMEAVIGALFLDHGFDTARAFVRDHWEALLDRQEAAPKHPKSALQEWAAKARRGTPVYDLVGHSGPDHARNFEVRVTLKGLAPVSATGASKQEAETAAARRFLEKHG